MFTHLLAGLLVFWIYGARSGWPISASYLLTGCIYGILPDIVSLILTKSTKIDRWSHLHRDNISHSVFFPIFTLIIVGSISGIDVGIVTSIAISTHPILDLFGIGWGVKLFYPLSLKQFKLFYDGRVIKIFYNQQELEEEVRKYGDDHWFQNLFLRPTLTALFEWSSLTTFIILVLHL